MPRKLTHQAGTATEKTAPILPLDTTLFAPGDRVCVAVSGGADSTALLRALLANREEMGIVLSVLHVEHGLRGQAALEDAAFVRALAEQHGLFCQSVSVDTPQRMEEQKESAETAARVLRYQVFRDVMSTGKVDKIATAHTLNDQAETVLMKLLRGAWTEGLSGIHPELRVPTALASRGQIHHAGSALCVRPLLKVRRQQIEDYLLAIDQPWRQDASNDSLAHTRNRIRHELLPYLREFNPQIDSILVHIADNARAEEQHWQTELERLLPLLLLPGRPTRGGGRDASTADGSAELALELGRVQQLDPAVRRRVLRAAAELAGATLDFEATERLVALVLPASPGSPRRKRMELTGGVSVERSPRELRFDRSFTGNLSTDCTYVLPVPGAVDAPGFGSRFTADWPPGLSPVGMESLCAQVRAWKPGDRVELQHSRGLKKVKEILNRMRIPAEDRVAWPVVTWKGNIIWMRGVALTIGQSGNGPAGETTGGLFPVPVISETRL